MLTINRHVLPAEILDLDCIKKMNNRNLRTGIKTIIFFSIAAVIFFTASLRADASDYQYKVLNPKYNPQAQQLIDGTLPAVEPISFEQPKKHFDFGAFFAIFALVTFPIFIISLALRTFKKFSQDVAQVHEPVLGNIKIEKKEVQEETTQNSLPEVIEKTAEPEQQCVSQNEPEDKPEPAFTMYDGKISSNTGNSINKFFSSPIAHIPNPMLLNTSPLSSNKGLCLVEYNKKYSLIGYINNEIFMLTQFDDVKSWEIRSRLSESKDSKDRYIVKLGDYKALVEVSDTNMDLLLEL